jgi:HSP20 family protein
MKNVEKKEIRPNGAPPEHVRGTRTYAPAVDIIERDQELLVIADVPGARAEDIDINYEGGELTLRASVQPRQDERSLLVREYGVGDFVRSFRIGEGIDPSQIEAEVHNGVLTVHFPKSDAARTRKIAVKTAK